MSSQFPVNLTGKKIDDWPWPEISRNPQGVSPLLTSHIGTIDATKWADEFMEVVKLNQISREIMVSWFANAIMCGYDEARRRYQEDSEESS